MNIFDLLLRKKSLLQKQRNDLEADYKRRLAEIDKQEEAISATANTIATVINPALCPVCKGDGYIQTTDAAGSRDTDTCAACKGTGLRLEEAHHDY